MATAKHMADARVLVGVDISKNRHDVLIAVLGRRGRKCLTVLNNAEDYESLIGLLRSFGLPVTIGFERQGTALTAIIVVRLCLPLVQPVSN